MNKIFTIFCSTVFFIACQEQVEEEEIIQISVNYYAPFSLYLSNGDVLNMQKTDYGFAFDSGGKALLFNFTISDCAPCETQNSYFSKLATKYKDLMVITIPLESLNQEEALMMKEFGNFNFEVAYGENNFFLAKAALDVVHGIPFSILYDKNGVMVQHYDGLMPPEMLEYNIKKVM